ncbi:GIP [Symbiodinium sp. CCMP2456]|nr:GIP [Symbiodinium sp. CCMP2456]
MALLSEAFVLGAAPPTMPVARLPSKPGRAMREIPERGGPSGLAAAAAVLVAGIVAKRSATAVALRAAGTSTGKKKKSGRSIAKETLARLRSRSPRKSPKSEGARKKMPPAPDPWELDEEGRKIFPWPKSFAEIVQTAAYSTMNLIMEGETRLEVCFPPLPLADLDWNLCDVTETRVVDANIQHAIAFAKLIIKDRRSFPQMNAEQALKAATEGAELQEPDKIKGHAPQSLLSNACNALSLQV